jgi:hypothetical protein
MIIKECEMNGLGALSITWGCCAKKAFKWRSSKTVLLIDISHGNEDLTLG